MSTATISFDVEIEDGQDETVIDMGQVTLLHALETLRESKPEERSEKARRYAVAITELEKVYAYYVTFVMEDGE